MADAMLLKLAMGASAGLDTKTEEAGQILVTTDTKKIYVDISDTERIEMNAAQADKVAEKMTLKVAGDTYEYDGSAAKTIGLVAGTNVQISKSGTNYTFTATDTTYESLKNPHGLTFGSKTYDGSVAMTISAADLGLSNAMHFIGTTTSSIAQSSTTNPIKVSGADYQPNAGDVVLYSQKEFVWNGSQWIELGDQSSYALKTVQITGDGTYITGGGTLSDDHILSHKLIDSPIVGTAGTASNHHVISNITTDAAGHVTGWTSRDMASEWADLTIQTSTTAATQATYTTTYDPATAKNFTIYTMKGASSSAAGFAGLVPAPAAGAITRLLAADGSWKAIAAGTGISVDGITITNAGVRSVAAKSNGVLNVNTNGTTAAVTVYTLPAATSTALGGVIINADTSNITNNNGTISITAANVRNALGEASENNSGYLTSGKYTEFVAAYDAVTWGTF